MHRDYQNLGVNGANSFDVEPNSHFLSRNQTNDHPLTVIVGMFGNDVCTSSHTVDEMTT
jgi:acyloxyacyl hydrolase